MSYCLVVEDSQEVRQVLCRLLSELGHHPLEAEGPASAVDICRSIAPPIIFLDWDMPDFGALELLRVMPAYKVRPQIVLCMARNDPRELALAKAAGATLQLMKPFDKGAILSALQRVECAVKANGTDLGPDIPLEMPQPSRVAAT